jgi:arabinofuranosyltransferase
MSELTPESSTAPATLQWAALAAALGLLAIHTHSLQPWTLDDAYISFRYAEHFGQGLGLVYNPGEYVEGFTTFLWVFLLGVGSWIGLEVEATAKVLGFAFASANVVLVCFANRLLPGLTARTCSIAALLLASSGIFNIWTMSGMEVPLAAFLLLGAVILQARAKDRPTSTHLPVLVGLTLALATLTRPELALAAGVLTLDRLRSGGAWQWRPALLTAAGFTALFLPFLVWRLFYYGYPVPNTFYAKVGHSTAQLVRGVRYCLDAVALLAPTLAPVVALAMLPRRRPVEAFGLLFAGAALCLHTLYIVWVGGDVMAAYRFFSPFLPVICLLCAAGLDRLGSSPRQLGWFMLVVLAYNLTANAVHRDLYPRVTGSAFGIGGQVGRKGKEVGLWLRKHAPADAVLATNTAGSVAFFSRLRAIDMLGLTDAHIAHREMPAMGSGRPGHEKGDGAYVLSRQPDYIQFGSSNGSRKPAFIGDREIAAIPGFEERYRFEAHPLPSGRSLKLYVRRNGKGLIGQARTEAD